MLQTLSHLANLTSQTLKSSDIKTGRIKLENVTYKNTIQGKKTEYS